MNIVGISGSPRMGNTEAILRMLLEDLGGLGVETELLLLRKLKIGFCDSCYKCFGKQKCTKEDDVSIIVHPKILAADALIFGSPSYFGSVSGQMKTLMDRCFPFINMYFPGPLRGKLTVNIITYGRGGGLQVAHPTFDQWCLGMGMNIFDNLSFKALEKNDAENSNTIRSRLHLAARELFEATNLKLKDKSDNIFPRLLATEKALSDKWKR